jgi:hypothetical protein
MGRVTVGGTTKVVSYMDFFLLVYKLFCISKVCNFDLRQRTFSDVGWKTSSRCKCYV